jgi:enoyl-CoA hydratase
VKYKKIIYEKQGEGPIARITFNDPEKLNRFPWQSGMTQEFMGALDEAEQDDDISVVIFKGAGRAFTAGHDLTEVVGIYGFGEGKKGEKPRRPSQRIRLKLDRKMFLDEHKRILLFPKITIAQVHGYCYGFGLMMAECCDFLIAAEDAKLAHPEQRIGFAGGGTGTIPLLMLTVGLKRAIDLLVTGRTIDGIEAERIGLASRAVPADQLEEVTNELAENIALLPRDGIAVGKATRHLIYDRLGVTDGFTQAYITHTLFTNLRYEPDEWNFVKERRDKGTKAAFHERDKRYTK